jgi:hypothetical protein
MQQKHFIAQILISVVALVAVLIHIATPLKLDNVSLTLLGIAVLPWLATVLQRAELPGGLKFEFQKIKTEQVRQARELDAIRFLIGNFLTVPEQQHLRKIAEGQPFIVKASKTSRFFGAELRRLRAHGFIRQIGKEGVRTLLQDDGKERDVCKFFEITEQGREYIQLRTEINEIYDDSPEA